MLFVRHLTCRPLLTAMFVFAVTASQVDGFLTFSFTYDADNSSAPIDLNDNNGQINDPTGDVLMDMMENAANLWNDIILDDWTINVDLRWQVPTLGNNFSGQMSLFQNHPNNVGNEAAEQDERVVWALIRMNPNRTWWVDPTPLDNSEFDMTQTLYRDLSTGSGGQQEAWYAGNVPDLLETGYRGFSNATAPTIMQSSNTRDLLTVAIHELGHTVGIGGTQAASDEVGTDADYDIPTNFVGGAVMDALSESTGNAHINPSSTSGAPVLMCRCGLGGMRRLPSAIDAFAGATTAAWDTIRIPRTDFLVGSDWNTAENWEGDRVPSAPVEAFVRHGGTVTLSSNGFAGRLTVDEDSTLVVTNSNRLSVFDTLAVQNLPGTGTTAMTVEATGEVFANRLVVGPNSRLLTAGLVDANDIVIEEGGELLGLGGTVVVSDVIGDFINNGRIAAVLNGTLTIDSDNLLDLDGAGDGELAAVAGDLVIDASLTDPFSGTATVGPGRTIAFNGGFGVDAGGLLHVDGEATNGATVTGIVSIGQGGVLRGDGRAIVNSALGLTPGGIVPIRAHK